MQSPRKNRQNTRPPRKEPTPVIPPSKYAQLEQCSRVFNEAVVELSKSKEAFEKEKKLMEKYKIDDILELNVGGCRITTYKSTLLSPITEGSMLSAMFSGRFPLKQDSGGCYFIDRPSEPFQWILDSIRTGEVIIPDSPSLHQKVLIELAYYGLEHPFFDSLYLPSYDSTILSNLSNVNLFDWLGDNKHLKLLYRYSRDGPNNFHNKCDTFSPTLTLIKSTNGYVFGGYTECKWDQSSSYKNGSSNNSSWLISLVRPNDSEPTRHFANSTTSHIYCASNCGPTFGGGHDLVVNGGTVSFNQSTYPMPHNNYLSGSSSLNIAEYEVFVVV